MTEVVLSLLEMWKSKHFIKSIWNSTYLVFAVLLFFLPNSWQVGYVTWDVFGELWVGFGLRRRMGMVASGVNEECVREWEGGGLLLTRWCSVVGFLTPGPAVLAAGVTWPSSHLSPLLLSPARGPAGIMEAHQEVQVQCLQYLRLPCPARPTKDYRRALDYNWSPKSLCV